MQTSCPVWRQLLEDLILRHAHLPFSKFVQVATIRTDGRPANRTLTFRFFLSDNRLLFTADTRTEKFAELRKHAWAELCWYFVEARVQFRLLGTMQELENRGAEEVHLACNRTWEERTDKSRQSFSWPRASERLSNSVMFTNPPASEPPSNFGLLGFCPQRVETLDLTSHPHAREVHALEDGAWRSILVNP